jgi:hypothetical protein
MTTVAASKKVRNFIFSPLGKWVVLWGKSANPGQKSPGWWFFADMRHVSQVGG